MESNTPNVFKSPATPKSHSKVLYSPKCNPFDELLEKSVEDTLTTSGHKSHVCSHQFSDDFLNVNRPFSCQDLSSDCFGRESIGILPSDFGKEAIGISSNLERDSLGFMNISCSGFGRESMGILNVNALNDSLSLRRESIGVLSLADFGRESLGCGRESLGILHLKSPDFKFEGEDKKIPNIMLTEIEENTDDLCSTLNTAFLRPHSRKTSAASSVSSVNPSFNSYSLEGPSRIYSLSSASNYGDSTSILNKAFSNTTELSNSPFSTSSVLSSILSPLNRGKFMCSRELFSERSRIQSLPVTLEDKFESFYNEGSYNVVSNKKFWSVDKTTKTKFVERSSFHGILDFNEEESEFYDSVFIEGHQIAEKIADGSILNESFDNEKGALDSTPQPDWPDELNTTEGKNDKYSTEVIFKTVDKMLPPTEQNNSNFSLKSAKSSSSSSSDSSSNKPNISQENNSKSHQTSQRNTSEIIQNISHISHEPASHSISRRSKSKSKDAKEILQNLSELINSTHRSDQQKSEGHNLLSSLADIIYEQRSNSKINSLDDSGHSSIHEQVDFPDKVECYEVLDLRKSKESNKCDSMEGASKKSEALDLSLKSKEEDKRLSQSFSSASDCITSTNTTDKQNISISGMRFNKNNSVASNGSANSADSQNGSNLSRPTITGKLRQKPSVLNSKRGPIKAVIPVGDMKKKSNNIAVTPERIGQKLNLMESKRTSTPINEPKLKPMAASTPTTSSIKGQKELTMVSPLARPKKLGGTSLEKINVSPSLLPKYSQSKLVRRNSISEVKRTLETVGKIKRSNSIENGSEIMSSYRKLRQNVIASPIYQSSKCLSKEKKNSGLSEIDENSGRKVLSIGKTRDSESDVIKKYSNTNNPTTSTKCQSKSVSSSKIEKSSARPSLIKDRTSLALPTPKVLTNVNTDSQRRNSMIEPKKVRENREKCKTNSIGRDSGIMSSLARVRQNILSSPYYQLKSQAPVNKNNNCISEAKVKGFLMESNSLPGTKPTNLFSKMKTAGKENVGE